MKEGYGTPNPYEVAATAAGWRHGGDFGGFWYDGNEYESWKAAASADHGATYDTAWAVCQHEGLDLTMPEDLRHAVHTNFHWERLFGSSAQKTVDHPVVAAYAAIHYPPGASAERALRDMQEHQLNYHFWCQTFLAGAKITSEVNAKDEPHLQIANVHYGRMFRYDDLEETRKSVGHMGNEEGWKQFAALCWREASMAALYGEQYGPTILDYEAGRAVQAEAGLDEENNNLEFSMR